MDFSNKNGNQSGNQSSNTGGGKKTIEFSTLPTTLEQFTAMPQAEMQSPYDTAAMFVVALSLYLQNKEASIAMMNYLKGPMPLSANKLSLMRTQMTDYLARSYFSGATPQNDYSPSQPYAVVISDNPHSYAEQGYAKLFVHCGGADSPRPVAMRLAKDSRWYVTEHSSLLLGIRKPESANPWA